MARDLHRELPPNWAAAGAGVREGEHLKTILVIEDEEAIRANILDLLEAEGFIAVGTGDGASGLSEARRLQPDVIVCDIMMPVVDGLTLLERVRGEPRLKATPFIFLTARAERADVRAGMSHGADDYVTKPFTRRDLLDAIYTRLERHDAMAGPHRPARVPPTSRTPMQDRLDRQALIVRSATMKALYDQADQVAQTPISVLILGDTGAGKEVLAYEIHRRSPRCNAPFVPLNCAALSPTLLESELFGHEKGAFTGAGQSQPGLLETAHEGTVFLDEIGELSPDIQVKLLRVIEDKLVTRVGSRRPREVDVRFISATNRDLEAEVAKGAFRRDLYFRLNGVSFEIPPLRTRREEIGPLAEHFVRLACDAVARPPLVLAPDTLRALEAYDFPGNVRELKNVIDRAVALCRDATIRPYHLPDTLMAYTEEVSIEEDLLAPPSPFDRLRTDMAKLERERIVEALTLCGGNQTKAADLLGISRRTLVSRLDTYGLPRPRKNPKS
jgi:two-component system, NtrC family, response regulator AtoC